ncbi:MAG: hypothetical protein M9932_16180 [Xanthobacteraceae bacterium]|nr:hypothetical protein [Xanthobacteraceae bacterium]
MRTKKEAPHSAPEQRQAASRRSIEHPKMEIGHAGKRAGWERMKWRAATDNDDHYVYAIALL